MSESTYRPNMDSLHYALTDIAQSLDPGEPSHDFRVQFEGSIVILWPDSDRASAWCEEHLPETCDRWGKNGYVIECRFIAGVVDGMIRDGLETK